MADFRDILAIIVLYNCRLEKSAAFCTLNQSLACSGSRIDILIYDNSPVPLYLERNFAIDNLNITYISDIHNSGVSKAYNTGIDLAESLGKKWLLLSDQDTSFPPDAMEAYARQTEKGIPLSAPMLLSGTVILSPCRYRWGHGKPLKHLRAGENRLRHKSVLNSGLLIHLDVFKKAGRYNADIPLDFSDHEWIERVRSHYRTIDVMDLACHHLLSSSETNVSEVLTRFRYYLAGAREYRKSTGSQGLWLTVLLRTVKLSLRFKTLDFFRCFLYR